MQEITVHHANGEYPIYIGKDLLQQPDLLNTHIKSQQVMIITNNTLAPFYLSPIKNLLAPTYQVDECIIPDGEQYKNLTQLGRVLDELIQRKHHRDTTLIALGGGVIGDLTGFTAACFHRGVNFIQIPTTLLAQVDASIGGKTAVNHPQGKNLIGAFHQPCAVFIDIAFLKSLPIRQYHAGLAEIIKAALICDANFFEYLEKNMQELLTKQDDVLLSTISRACTIKRDIVDLDEKEQHVRALLNLGHTFGHAIEQNMSYMNCLHGEAVAIGIVLAATLSIQLEQLTLTDRDRIIRLLQQAQLPTTLPRAIDPENLMTALYSDKKILNNRLRFILLQAIGQAVINESVTEPMLQAFIKHELSIL